MHFKVVLYLLFCAHCLAISYGPPPSSQPGGPQVKKSLGLQHNYVIFNSMGVSGVTQDEGDGDFSPSPNSPTSSEPGGPLQVKKCLRLQNNYVIFNRMGFLGTRMRVMVKVQGKLDLCQIIPLKKE